MTGRTTNPSGSALIRPASRSRAECAERSLRDEGCVREATLRAFGFAGLRATLRRSARPGAFGPGDLDGYAEAWTHPGSLAAMLNYCRALRERRRGAPSRIAPATLVLWGERDSFLDHHLATACVALCDDGRLVAIEDATH